MFIVRGRALDAEQPWLAGVGSLPRDTLSAVIIAARSCLYDLAQSLYVLHRRHTKLTLKLSAELRCTFVSNRLGGGARVVAVVDHQTLRSVKPYSLEILNR